MRYQVVVLASEVGDAIEIESFSWKRSPSPDDHGTFIDMAIYMGLCDSDQLELTFDNNYISGSRTLVMSSPSYTTETVGVNEWFTFVFDTPFWYNGQDNLLIEIEWSDGLGSLYTWHWNGSGSTYRSMYGLFGMATSLVQGPKVPNIRLNGTLSLSNSTFARIKAAF